MNKILFVLLCLVFSLCSYGQTRKINGLIFEHLNKKPIMGVKISPVLNEDDCFSNPLGEFTAIVYYKYFDSLVFTHPEYHTYVHEINRGNKNTLNIIMISNDYPIDTLINPDLDENISIYGVVLDSPARKILKNACIRLKSNQIISRSLYNGTFTATLPRSADSILVTHPECLSKTVSLKAFKRKGPSSPTSRRIMLTRVIEPIVPPPEIFVDTVISSDKEESKEIYGFIIDSISRKSILNVNIRLENNQIIFNTEQKGHFNVLIPLSSQNILITHPDYRSKTVSVDLLKRRGGGAL